MSEPEYNLTLGVNQLIYSLEQAYPNLPSTELEILGNALLGQIANALEAGESLASLRQNADGQIDLRIWTIGPLEQGEER